jgi:hypothetical protein
MVAPESLNAIMAFFIKNGILPLHEDPTGRPGATNLSRRRHAHFVR